MHVTMTPSCFSIVLHASHCLFPPWEDVSVYPILMPKGYFIPRAPCLASFHTGLQLHPVTESENHTAKHNIHNDCETVKHCWTEMKLTNGSAALL